MCCCCVTSVVADSVWPHRWEPTRLPRPWDSPGKNTGVGCHFLLQCRKVKSEREVAQSCPTFSDPMDCSPPGSSDHGIFQARVPEWGAIAFSVVLISSSKLISKLIQLTWIIIPRWCGMGCSWIQPSDHSNGCFLSIFGSACCLVSPSHP